MGILPVIPRRAEFDDLITQHLPFSHRGGACSTRSGAFARAMITDPDLRVHADCSVDRSLEDRSA